MNHFKDSLIKNLDKLKTKVKSLIYNSNNNNKILSEGKDTIAQTKSILYDDFIQVKEPFVLSLCTTLLDDVLTLHSML